MDSINVEIILQVVGILVVIFGVAYLIQYTKKNKVIVDEDYLNLTYQIAQLIEGSLATDTQVKQVTRLVMKTVKYIELEMKNAPNPEKEDAAVALVKEGLSAIPLKKPLQEETIRQIIRLACLFLEATNKEQ